MAKKKNPEGLSDLIDQSEKAIEHMLAVEIKDSKQLSEEEKKLDISINALFNYLSITFDEDISFKLRYIYTNGFEDFWFSGGSNFDFRLERYLQNLQLGKARLKLIEQIISISDPYIIEHSLKLERNEWTVQEKKDLLLEKLYLLRKSETHFSARLLLKLNDVGIDDQDEPHQISEELKKSGYVTSGEGIKFPIKISAKGKTYVEKKQQKNTAIKTPAAVNKMKNTSNSMDIFITHSSHDEATAALVIELIRSALNISAKRIRCTSVNGYRLPAGASTDNQLKLEVSDCKVLVGIISEKSMNSPYVLFELGARWGMSKPLMPIAVNSEGMKLLKGPLAGINVLDISNTPQLHQFIADLASQLGKKAENASVYHHHLESLITHLKN